MIILGRMFTLVQTTFIMVFLVVSNSIFSTVFHIFNVEIEVFYVQSNIFVQEFSSFYSRKHILVLFYNYDFEF